MGSACAVSASRVRYVLLLGHAVEHVVAPDQHPLGAVDGGEPARVLGQAGHERGLGQRQVARRLAEEELARGFHPVVSVAEVDLVAVEREDLLLREVLLELEGQDHLLDLPLVGLLRGQEEQPRELHGEGRRALALAARAVVRDGGAGDAPGVHPHVLPEIRVLHRHHRVAQHGRDVLEGHHHPPLDRELAQDGPVGREDLGDDVGLEVLEGRDLGQVALVGQEDAEERSRHHRSREQGGHDDAAEGQYARPRRPHRSNETSAPERAPANRRAASGCPWGASVARRRRPAAWRLAWPAATRCAGAAPAHGGPSLLASSRRLATSRCLPRTRPTTRASPPVAASAPRRRRAARRSAARTGA